MQKITKIMVAVDQSDYALPSLSYASDLARALNARIILASIYNQRDYATVQNTIAPFDPKLSERIFEEQMDDRRNYVNRLTKKAGAEGTVVRKIVRVGVPYQELLAIIKEEQPDLLVMGTKGRSNLGDTIVGSCAQKMYRRSPIPVLSLRPTIKNNAAV